MAFLIKALLCMAAKSEILNIRLQVVKKDDKMRSARADIVWESIDKRCRLRMQGLMMSGRGCG